MTMVEMIIGKITIRDATRLPLNSRLKRNARAVPSTTSVILATRVKTSVLTSERWKSSSLRIREKFWKPTNVLVFDTRLYRKNES